MLRTEALKEIGSVRMWIGQEPTFGGSLTLPLMNYFSATITPNPGQTGSGSGVERLPLGVQDRLLPDATFTIRSVCQHYSAEKRQEAVSPGDEEHGSLCSEWER